MIKVFFYAIDPVFCVDIQRFFDCFIFNLRNHVGAPQCVLILWGTASKRINVRFILKKKQHPGFEPAHGNDGFRQLGISCIQVLHQMVIDDFFRHGEERECAV